MSYAFCKWSTIFKCNFSISITLCGCYVSCYKNICIWIITKIWFSNFFSNLILEPFSSPSPYSVLFWWLITYHLLLAKFEDSLLASPNKFTVFWVFIFIPGQNQTMVAKFWVNLKVVSSDFSMMKNVASSFLSSLPIKLICCFKSGFLIQFVCLNLLSLVCNVLRSTGSLINYHLCNHYFFSFQRLLHMLLCFLLMCKKTLFHQLMHWNLLFEHLVHNTLKKMFYRFHFRMTRQIIYWLYLTSVMLDQSNNKLLFWVWLVITDLYLFHLIVLLKPVLNCSKSLLSSSVDKVTTGTYNFVSVILSVTFVGLSISLHQDLHLLLLCLLIHNFQFMLK